jgi:hypothetical protein
LNFRFSVAISLSLCVVFVALGLPQDIHAGGLAGPVVISEFMASNDTTFMDEDGHFSDWIEVQSVTTGTVNLSGWHLTNDPNDLEKWPFPSVNLGQSETLVVFASRKDRRNPNEWLHANFLLGAGGSYLALIDPSGTITTEFSPEYPNQRPDVSYGFAQIEISETVVAPGAAGKYLVPSSDIGLTWTLPGFADTSWTSGTAGFGFDEKTTPTFNDFISTNVSSEMRFNNASIFIRIPFSVSEAGSFILRLGMHFEDGFVAYVNGTRIAGKHDPVDPEWNSAATNSILTRDALEGEDFVSPSVQLFAGTNILAIHGLNRTVSSSDAFFYPELDRIVGIEQTGDLRYFAEPTPEAPNGEGSVGITPEPQLSPPGSVFVTNQSVSLATIIPGATVRYTLGFDEPDENSPVLDEFVVLTATTILNAKAFRDGFVPSATVSHSYMKVTTSVTGFDSHLPTIYIDTFGQSVGTSWLDAHVHVVDVDATGESNVLGFPDFSGLAAVKRRGSSTQNSEKVNMSVEIRDPFRNDRDVSLVGMPAESDWVLWGPTRYDRAMMRNSWIYEISDQIGYQAVRTRFVEVFLNTGPGALTGPAPSGDYFGVYVLMEKIKRGPDRVNVDPLEVWNVTEPDISGGYVLKIDRPDPGDLGFTTASCNCLQMLFVDPKEEEILPEQTSWIRSYMNSFFAALDGPNYTSPTVGYAKYIDVDNFIEFHILQEFSKNPDAHILSTYLKKLRNEKLFYAPLWDFDRTMGNDNDARAANPIGDSVVKNGVWWGRLFSDPELSQKYRDRWHELRQNQMSVAHMHALVDSMAAEIGEAATRNFTRWQSLTGLSPSGWPTEVAQLKSWQQTRAEWIDSLYPVPPTLTEPSQLIQPTFLVGIDADVGDVYYTLDGSDPRLSGGAVAPGALQAGVSGDFTTLLSPDLQSRVRVLVPGPEHAALGATWTARLFNDSSWPLGTSGIAVGYEVGIGYGGLIDFDVEAQMHNSRTSVYIRVEFEVTDPSEFTNMTLRMKYDDGFVAYLNGVRITEDREPLVLTWESSATSEHPDVDATDFRNFEVSAHVGELVVGTNVLAIHGLNVGDNSSDLLFIPELIASEAPIVNSVAIDDFARVTARALHLGDWTAPAKATYVLDDALDIRITELMYHPIPPAVSSLFNDEDYEFVEVQNTSNVTVDIRGLRFTDGIEFDFADGSVTTLGPQEYVVVVKNLAAFQATYLGSGIQIAGIYEGQFANQGEHVRLENGIGEVIQEFTYDDAWYLETDGQGSTLNLVDVFDDPDNWSTRDGWQVGAFLGSPGASVGESQVPGDTNLDGNLGIGDAISMLLLMFRGGVRALPCEGANVSEGGNVDLLDFDGDQQVDKADVIGLLSFMFLDGPEHVLGTRCVRIAGCEAGCQ